MHVYEILRRPVVTEKSGRLGEQGQYVFEVDRRANKAMVKQAVEKAFNVNVLDVNIMMMKAKMGRYGRRQVIKTSDWKKAIVTLAPGDRIEFENVVIEVISVASRRIKQVRATVLAPDDAAPPPPPTGRRWPRCVRTASCGRRG